MRKSDRELLKELYELTELNVKRIERYSRQYASPVINQYRYALGHLIGAGEEASCEINGVKALAHLREAYYDSCDILLDWLICSGKYYFENVSEVKGLSAICGIDEYEYRLALKRAKEDRFAPDEARTARAEERYARIADSIKRLCEYQNQIRDNRFSIWKECERYKRNLRREIFFKIIIAVVTLVASLLSLHMYWR